MLPIRPFALDPAFEKDRMPPFMHQAQKVNGVVLDCVVDEEGKRSGAPTRETVRTHMIAPCPLDHFPSLARYSLAESACQPHRASADTTARTGIARFLQTSG